MSVHPFHRATSPFFGPAPAMCRTAWFCVRRDGARRREGWFGLVPGAELRAALRIGSRDVAEVSVFAASRDVPAESLTSVFAPRARGLIGMEVSFGPASRAFAPSDMIARNLGFSRALERCLSDWRLSPDDLRTSGRVRAFVAAQCLVPGGRADAAVALFRGSPLVEPDLAPPLATLVARGVERWMLENVSPSGALPYKYWPSRGEYSGADNAIRRFLASIALARSARLPASAPVAGAAERTLGSNLARYFRVLGDGRGVIVEPAGAKLGAAALAGLAILEAPSPARFADPLRRIARAVRSLAGGPCGFRTFFFPAERDGQSWNFYSGEALLFWAEALRRGAPGMPPLERCARVFARCVRRHLARPNPAFVPWCSQAAASLYLQTSNRAFADIVFAMSDWLAPMQQFDDVDPDCAGRFHDPCRPHFGPPHASSTGVYLEGLADAAALARRLGRAGRAERYGVLVRRGLRSLRQLQFRDARDAFYVSKPERVLGALRTEVHDNTIRLDNAAHALAACVKVLRPLDAR